MSSSISSSDARPAWRRFFALAVGTALAAGIIVYAFVALVDPWDTLPLSPPLHRVPISTDARFSFPALARQAQFDSAIFGTSTSRLLRPDMLDPLAGDRFVNLAMNSATAYEQSRLMGVFARAHPDARTIIIGLDVEWCGTGESYDKYTPRPFPEWMYETNLWPAYLDMFSLYAVQEAGRQFAVMAGLKSRRYGLDGYTSFVPDESEYDIARVRAHMPPHDPPLPAEPSTLDPAALNFPTHPLLATSLARFSPRTRKVLFFVPYYVGLQPAPGSDAAVTLEACKAGVARIAAAVPNSVVADFMIPSPITNDDTHYWDPLHYRIPIADRVMRDLAGAIKDEPAADGDYKLTALKKP